MAILSVISGLITVYQPLFLSILNTAIQAENLKASIQQFDLILRNCTYLLSCQETRNERTDAALMSVCVEYEATASIHLA